MRFPAILAAASVVACLFATPTLAHEDRELSEPKKLSESVAEALKLEPEAEMVDVDSTASGPTESGEVKPVAFEIDLDPYENEYYDYGGNSSAADGYEAFGMDYGMPSLFGDGCCGPTWRVFGEFLYLRPGKAAMVNYALPINGAITPSDPPVPTGPVALVDPDYEVGYRTGFAFLSNEDSEWGAMLTFYESDTTSAVGVDAADVTVLRSLIVHPSTSAADAEFLDAQTSNDIEMYFADLEYRKLFADCWYRANYLLGVRYAHLDQQFASRFSNSTTIETVDTTVGFDGGGLRGGLEAEWHAQNTGFLLYGKGYASLVAGRFKSSFIQQDNFSGVVAHTSRVDDRVVPILDLELGVGWRSKNEHWRLTAGYLFSSWLNVVSNDNFIHSVHTSQYRNLDDSLTFDGLTARAEFRY